MELNSFLQDRDNRKEKRILSLDEQGEAIVDFKSNDYLGLARHPAVIQAAREALWEYGSSSSGSRLISGNLSIHQELEDEIAECMNREAALLVGNGFMANLSLFSTFVRPDDVVIIDRNAHASLLMGLQISRAKFHRFFHNDVGHVEEIARKVSREGRVFIITESLFSVDGDEAPLIELDEVARKYDLGLILDEAHALGVFGKNGGGLSLESGIKPLVLTAAAGKALGSFGGFIVGSRTLMDYAINMAKPFIYSTGLPPASAAASLAALRIIRKEKSLTQRLLRESAEARQYLQGEGLEVIKGRSQIIAIEVSGARKIVEIEQRLANRGVLVGIFRYPSVPAGKEKLRICFSLKHHVEQRSKALKAIVEEVHCCLQNSSL